MVHVLVNSVEYIREHPRMFLRSGRPGGQELAESILRDALVLTDGGPVSVMRRGDWWVVACEDDWMGRQSSGSVDDLFSKIVPFPEAGPNSMHSEILLTAFANEVLLKGDATLRAIKGSVAEDDEICDIFRNAPHWKRGVAFRVEP